MCSIRLASKILIYDVMAEYSTTYWTGIIIVLNDAGHVCLTLICVRDLIKEKFWTFSNENLNGILKWMLRSDLFLEEMIIILKDLHKWKVLFKRNSLWSKNFSLYAHISYTRSSGKTIILIKVNKFMLRRRV